MPKLHNRKIVSFGRTKRLKKVVKEQIQSFGGIFEQYVCENTFAFIGTEKNVADIENCYYMQTAKRFGIHVVREDFLDKIKDADDVVALLHSESICDWGKDVILEVI